MNILKYKTVVFLSCCICCMSCTESVDFNQVENLEVTPELEASFIHFNEPANRFLANGSSVSISQEFVNIGFFRNKFTTDNLTRVELVFETKNTINRAFEFIIDFIDSTDSVQHSITIQENAAADNTDTVSTYSEVFEDNKLLALKQTVKIAYTLRLLGGIPIETNTPGRLECKSYAAFQINLIE